MFAAPLLLCLASMPAGEILKVRDLAPFSRLDDAVRNLPVSSPRSFASVAKSLAGLSRSPLEKARAAYVWTTSNMAYRLDRSRDATTALADLAGDCEAHAAVYTSLCKALGIECATVGGAVRYAVPPSAALASVSKPLAPGQWLVGHAWNAVRIDGCWGLVDATMGGRTSPKNGSQAPADDYFLPHPAVMASDHVPDEARWSLVSVPKNLSRSALLRPLTWRLGIEGEELDADARQDGSRLLLRPRLAWRKGMRAALQTQAGSVPDRVLVQPSANGTEIRLSPPGPASIVWLGMSVEGEWRPIAGYPVVGLAADRLPKVMTRFYDSGASLAGPFESVIPAGRPTEIRLRAPGAEQVVAFQGNDLAGKFVREGDSWVFRAAPSTGPLEVMASYDDPRKFQGLLTYDVR